MDGSNSVIGDDDLAQKALAAGILALTWRQDGEKLWARVPITSDSPEYPVNRAAVIAYLHQQGLTPRVSDARAKEQECIVIAPEDKSKLPESLRSLPWTSSRQYDRANYTPVLRLNVQDLAPTTGTESSIREKLETAGIKTWPGEWLISQNGISLPLAQQARLDTLLEALKTANVPLAAQALTGRQPRVATTPEPVPAGQPPLKLVVKG